MLSNSKMVVYQAAFVRYRYSVSSAVMARPAFATEGSTNNFFGEQHSRVSLVRAAPIFASHSDMLATDRRLVKAWKLLNTFCKLLQV